MTILGNLKEDNSKKPQIEKETAGGKLYGKTYEGINFPSSLTLSTVSHAGFFLLLFLGLFILTLLGITLDIFKRPEPPKKDIEFVLVTKEGTPINKNTRYRADINSRAGGKHNPRRPVSEPKAAAPKAAQPKKAAAAQPKTAVKKATTSAAPKASSSSKAVSPKAETKTAPKVAPLSPRPKTTSPKPTINPKSTMQIPFPTTKDYSEIGPAAGGPVAGTQKGKSSSSGSSVGSAASAPTPSFSPSSSGGSKSSKGGTGTSSGNYGNPGPGNPMGAPGIDAIREPDFGPYMKELQRRIKMNWTPPKGNESKRVVLLFSISRDGRLLSVKVHKSSGLPAADQAAIQAVQLTAPFKPLPPEYRDSSVDIQFTFDYNVFGASKY